MAKSAIIGVLSACAFLLASACAATEGPPAGEFEAVAAEPQRALGWDSGQLTVLARGSQGEKAPISVEFSSSGQALTSLSVKTPEWSADLTGQVSKLKGVYPSRLIVLVVEWTDQKTIGDLLVKVPFTGDEDVNACHAVYLVVQNGAVIHSRTKDAPGEECFQ